MSSRSAFLTKIDWPAPAQVKAFSTTRQGGYSLPPYASFNLASHVGDDEVAVNKNRQALSQSLPSPPIWLNQTHTNRVIRLTDHRHITEDFDASFSTEPNIVCTVLTADCLPILLTDRQGSFVAAIHAGWRGLATDIIANTIRAIPKVAPREILAWFGPAIGPQAFTVGDEVRTIFIAKLACHITAFETNGPDQWSCNIYTLATQQLNGLGVAQIYGGHHCTVLEAEQFYSYRREGQCGRMATGIFLI